MFIKGVKHENDMKCILDKEKNKTVQSCYISQLPFYLILVIFKTIIKPKRLEWVKEMATSNTFCNFPDF